MAENDTQQHDRTEQASTKRLEDARARGQVPRSRELAATAVVISASLTLLIARDYYATSLARLFELGLNVPRAALFDAGVLPKALIDALAQGLELLAPVAIATIGAAVLGTTGARRLGVQHRSVGARFLAAESRHGHEARDERERPDRALEGAREVRDRRRDRGPPVVAVERRFPLARHADAPGGDRSRGVARRHLAGRARGEPRAHRGRGRAVPVLASPPAAAHDEAGNPRRAEGDRGSARGSVAHPQSATLDRERAA